MADEKDKVKIWTVRFKRLCSLPDKPEFVTITGVWGMNEEEAKWGAASRLDREGHRLEEFSCEVECEVEREVPGQVHTDVKGDGTRVVADEDE